MSKTKHAKPEEFHLQQIRHYKKEIRRKDQEIKRLQKELNYRGGKLEKPEKESRKINLCPECGKGEITISDIGIRRFEICKLCNYRSRTN